MVQKGLKLAFSKIGHGFNRFEVQVFWRGLKGSKSSISGRTCIQNNSKFNMTLFNTVQVRYIWVHYDFNLLICCVIYLGILNFSLLNIEFNCLRILFSFLVLRYFENISIPCCSCTVKCCATHYALVYFRSEKILTLVSLLFL